MSFRSARIRRVTTAASPSLAVTDALDPTRIRGGRVLLVVIALTFAFAANSAAADASFTARGSVEQVYATGLPAGRAGVAARLRRPGGRDQERQRPRRGAVPQRHAGRRLPRPPRRRPARRPTR